MFKVSKIELMEEECESSIEELYNLVEKTYNTELTLSNNGHEMLDINDIIHVLTTDRQHEYQPYYGEAKRIMKHRVSKGKWCIHAGDKEIIMTEDHGNVVLRMGELVRLKPCEILPGDILVIYDKDSNTCKFEDDVYAEYIGEFEDEYVYDIEMSNDPHVFFANDILIHNSLYVRIDPLTDSVTMNETLTEDDMRKICKKVDELCNDINLYSIDFVKREFNSDEVTIKFGREHYCSQGAFLAKKRYVIRSMNKEGAKTSDGQYLIKESWKYTGVEIKKSEHPDTVKEMLKEIIHECIKTRMSSDRYNREISKYYEKYKNFLPNEMAYWKGYNTVKESDGFLETEKGTGLAAKAALYYNDMLKELNLTDKYEAIQLGDRFRISYVVPSNPYGISVIGWQDKFPDEFKNHFELDYSLMFKKIFLGAMKRFEAINGWSVSDPTEEVEYSLSDL